MSVNSSNGINLPIIQKNKHVMSADEPVYIASYVYLQSEFANARQYEAGILGDQDPEFLHQYRVCLRRSRAIISLLKNIFPRNEKKGLSILLKNLMQKTNLLRDLDVYLLKKDMFFKQLDNKHHRGLAGFFNDIRQRRTTELNCFCDWLRSASYQQQCLEIESQLQAIKESLPPQSESILCGTYARKTVWKRFKKVSHRVTHIDKQSEDTQIHKLRIDCKKLRYLLEYFEALFKKSDYQRELNSLKELQNYLGDFNDSSVQHDFLSHYLAHKNETSRRYKAVRKLLHISQKQQQQTKIDALQQVKHFLLPQTQLNYQNLCQLPAQKG